MPSMRFASRGILKPLAFRFTDSDRYLVPVIPLIWECGVVSFFWMGSDFTEPTDDPALRLVQ